MKWLFDRAAKTLRQFIVLIVILFAFVDICPAVAAVEIVCRDASASLVFDTFGNLVIAANDVTVSRFSYDDDNRVTRAETLIGEAVFDVAWQRDVGEWEER